MFPALALAALIIEAIAGYPQALVRRIGHPVMWIGALIAWTDESWNWATDSFATRRLRGTIFIVALTAAMIAIGLVLEGVLHRLLPEPYATLALGAIASTLIAQRSLGSHVAAVAQALDRDGLTGAREAVAMIVGRDPERLDRAGISRAAIESLAENFSDGIVAPLLWLVVAGLPGILVYKAVNTCDSMIGHLSERHRAFGWASARLDDLINLPASRLAALWLILASAILPDGAPGAAWRAVRRDAAKHRSPNAGWPEAVMAGALGLRLAGPRVYHGERVEDSWMGEGSAEADAADIRRALRLYRMACVLQAGVVAALAFIIVR